MVQLKKPKKLFISKHCTLMVIPASHPHYVCPSNAACLQRASSFLSFGLFVELKTYGAWFCNRYLSQQRYLALTLQATGRLDSSMVHSFLHSWLGYDFSSVPIDSCARVKNRPWVVVFFAAILLLDGFLIWLFLL